MSVKKTHIVRLLDWATGLQDIDSNTPLHLAAANKQVRVVKLLLNEGVDPRNSPHFATSSHTDMVNVWTSRKSLLLAGKIDFQLCSIIATHKSYTHFLKLRGNFWAACVCSIISTHKSWTHFIKLRGNFENSQLQVTVYIYREYWQEGILQ